MRRKFLGDGRDFLKRGILQTLIQNGSLRELKVFPMFTGEMLYEDELLGYAAILGIDPTAILNENTFRHQDGYFGPAGNCSQSDIFLDVDTGVAEEGQGRLPTHVTYAEVLGLLPIGSDRIVVTFQSRPNHDDPCISGSNVGKGEVLRFAMSNKLHRLATSYPDLAIFCYFDSVASFVFFARRHGGGTDRLHTLATYLRDVLRVPEKHLIGPI